MEQVESNPRGIPKAPFVDDVDAYMSGGKTADAVIRSFNEALSKYRFMEANMTQRKGGLEGKLPEIKKSLTMVEYLISNQESGESFDAHYELNDTLYAKATIPPTQTVNLWLGANVMLEYTLEEAKDLLESKLGQATQSHSNAVEDLEYLRDQITTMEVNTARVYNWDIKNRRESKAKATEKA